MELIKKRINNNNKIYAITKKKIIPNYELYIMFFPVLIYYIIFHYIPIYGVQIAFKDFIASKGIWKSPWTGLENIKLFLNTYNFWTIIKNTIGIRAYVMSVCFPIPIILSLMLNEVKHERYKKVIQTVTYAPHFISIVVLVGMVLLFLSPSAGFVNIIIKAFGGNAIDFMAKPELFKTIFVFMGMWQNTGWGAIIYIAVLSGIDTQLYESAIIDGATKLQRIWYINIPGIIPTATILFILNMGHIMDVGFEKILLLQNPLNISTSEVISTYVYRCGILGARFSFGAAVGLFNNVINLIALLIVNKIAKKVSTTSLW